MEIATLMLALGVSLALRPWRMLANGDLISPLVATLTILPFLWAMPRLDTMPIPLQLSGACAVTLMLGWPLAVLTLVGVALLSSLISPASVDILIAQSVWEGIVPATFALLAGILIRRLTGTKVFVFILGRAFAATIVCTFLAAVLAQYAGYEVPHVGVGTTLVGRWLLAWGDGFMTGMIVSIFVAFRPHWLATWSDKLYLQK